MTLARVKDFDGDELTLATSQNSPCWSLIRSFEVPRRVSRRVLRRESLRESLRAWLRVQVILRESLRGSLRVWLRVCIQMCLHSERECCVRALGNQLSVDNRDCERMRVQIPHTRVARNTANTSADSASSTTTLTRTTQLRCVKPRTGTTDAAKVKQVELWRWEKCDLRTKAWEAREIQLEVRVGAKRECLPKLGA